MPLARAFYEIEKRGILVDQERLEKFKKLVDERLIKSCEKIEQQAGLKVIPKKPKGSKTSNGELNLSSVPQLKEFLKKKLNIKLKVDFKTKKESTGEEALNDAYAKIGHQTLKEILTV